MKYVIGLLQNKRLMDRLVIFSLVSGMICFGFVFADSTSDHNKMLHFAAHFGMSFLILSFSYAFCNLKWNISRQGSYSIAILLTLLVGCLYKYFEISSLGLLHGFAFGQLLQMTGCYTSMSQNMAGIFAGMLIIQYFFGRRVVLLEVK